MDAHFVGQDHSEERRGITGTSLAVAQFLAIARGVMPKQKPMNSARVSAVRVEERYCSYCYGMRWFDVVRVETWLIWFHRCRCCGAHNGAGG